MVMQLPQFDDSEADTLLAVVRPLGLNDCVPPQCLQVFIALTFET